MEANKGTSDNGLAKIAEDHIKQFLMKIDKLNPYSDDGLTTREADLKAIDKIVKVKPKNNSASGPVDYEALIANNKDNRCLIC